MEHLLELKSISKSYGSSETVTNDVLDNINFEVKANTSTAIIGPSGSGKSTLLKIAGLLENPSRGHVYWFDKEISKMTEEEKRVIRRDNIGFVFQDHQLLPQATLIENVLLPCLTKGAVSKYSKDYKRAEEFIDFLGISERKQHLPSQLSGGECQRVAVIRSLMNQPKLLLADEPSGALDKKNSEQLLQLLLVLQDQFKFATVVVTHSTELASCMQKCFRLETGQLAEV